MPEEQVHDAPEEILPGLGHENDVENGEHDKDDHDVKPQPRCFHGTPPYDPAYGSPPEPMPPVFTACYASLLCTRTGMQEWVSTFCVSLPSTSALTPLLPCEAMKMRSHPLRLAASMIA